LKLTTLTLCFLIQILIAPAVSGVRRARPAQRCPQLVIACPLETVEQDTQLRFSAMVAGSDPNPALTYTWSLSSGKISEGQGTPSIIVDTTALGGRRVTAKVLVGGLASECQSALSCAVFVMKPAAAAEAMSKPTDVVVNRPPVSKPPISRPTEKPAPPVVKPVDAGGTNARRLDDYGDLPLDVERKHLAGLARELQAAPGAQGYIIVYGGRCAGETQALERAERAKEWLINKHAIDASRIVVIDGGYRETLTTEIFVGPVDATLPELQASVQPPDQSRCK
jgi:hypothetical protein